MWSQLSKQYRDLNGWDANPQKRRYPSIAWTPHLHDGNPGL
jgi:hypothetical protein